MAIYFISWSMTVLVWSKQIYTYLANECLIPRANYSWIDVLAWLPSHPMTFNFSTCSRDTPHEKRRSRFGWLLNVSFPFSCSHANLPFMLHFFQGRTSFRIKWIWTGFIKFFRLEHGLMHRIFVTRMNCGGTANTWAGYSSMKNITSICIAILHQCRPWYDE